VQMLLLGWVEKGAAKDTTGTDQITD